MAKRTLNPTAFALLLVFALTSYGGANILRFEALAQSHLVWSRGPAAYERAGFCVSVDKYE